MKIRIQYDRKERDWTVDDGESIEYVELTNAEVDAALTKFGGLYLVDSWSGQIKKFIVVDNETEAIQSFKKEIAFFLYELIDIHEVDENEVVEAEKLLEKYGFQQDMKNAYAILEASGGKVDSRNIMDFLKEKYPNYDSNLIMNALSALQVKGYMKWDVENDILYFAVAKKLDF